MASYHALARTPRGLHTSKSRALLKIRESSPHLANLNVAALRSAHTVAQRLAQTPSHTYLSGLGKASHAQTQTQAQAQIEGDTNSLSKHIKLEIASLLRDRSYDALLATLTKWTAADLPVPWKKVLDQREMAHLLLRLIEYQKDILFKGATQKSMAHATGKALNVLMASLRQAREQIRAIYANLLHGGDPQNGKAERGASATAGAGAGAGVPHLYSMEAGNLDAQPPAGTQPAAFALSAADYENLIALELNNAKLDLASRWFQHMTRHFGLDAVHRHMTPGLWRLKFRLFGDGEPALWRVEKSPINDVIVNPRQSRFKHLTRWLDLLSEFTAQQHALLDKSRPLFTSDLVSVMISTIAYSRNVDQTVKLIETNWGISPKGTMAPGFVKPEADSPVFPDLDVLTLVTVAMLFNQKFVQCMAYINAFQQHYDIALSRPHSGQFWDQLFRWAEISTQYSEPRAFHFYVKQAGSLAFAGSEVSLSDDFPVLLAAAKSNADFDYESFLKFVDDLGRQRVGLLSELWKCFHESNAVFSVRPYTVLLKSAAEYLQPLVLRDVHESLQLCATACYDLLLKLYVEHVTNSANSASFNVESNTETVAKIRTLYSRAMKLLVHSKGQAGRLGEIPHIIAKWGLDVDMKEDLRLYAQRHEREYLERMNSLESQRLIEEEEEGFLDLI